jgi:hypothetical protein
MGILAVWDNLYYSMDLTYEEGLLIFLVNYVAQKLVDPAK